MAQQEVGSVAVSNGLLITTKTDGSVFLIDLNTKITTSKPNLTSIMGVANYMCPVYNGVAYFVGNDGAAVGTTIRTYTFSTDVWDETSVVLPVALQGPLFANIVGTKLYVFGGTVAAGTVNLDVFIYNISTNSWSTISGAFTATGNVAQGSSCAVGTKIYYTNVSTVLGFYDTTTDTFGSSSVSIPGASEPFTGMFDYNGKLALVFTNTSDNTVPPNRLRLYDPIADSWEVLVMENGLASEIAAFSDNGRFYAVAGAVYNTNIAQALEIYELIIEPPIIIEKS